MWALLRSSPSPGLSSLLASTPSRLFKVVSAVKRRCPDCRIVQRGKKVYVLCNENPRHKQRQGKKGSIYRPS